MTMQIIALIFVVLSFTALFAWVFWPSNRDRLEAKGQLALDADDSALATATSNFHSQPRQGEQS